MNKGCIYENCNVKELIKDCVEYLEDIENIRSTLGRNEVWDDEEGEVVHYGKSLSNGNSIELDDAGLLQAHKWVLHNMDEVQPWIE
jgi:hypothetical protein